MEQLSGRRRETFALSKYSLRARPGPPAGRCPPWQQPVEQLVHPLLALFLCWTLQPSYFYSTFLLFVAREVN